MKKRITKNKILDKLTKMVDEAYAKVISCEFQHLDNARKEWHSRYNTLVEIRSFINDHRI